MTKLQRFLGVFVGLGLATASAVLGTLSYHSEPVYKEVVKLEKFGGGEGMAVGATLVGIAAVVTLLFAVFYDG